MSLYSAGNLIQITDVTGSAFTGRYAADGSWNGVNKTSATSTYCGLINPCGAINYVIDNGSTPHGKYHPNGALYVTDNGTLNGGLSVAFTWTPAMIGSYWDISNLGSLFTEISSESTAASVDGPVGTVRDLSGNGLHLRAGTNAKRPTLRQSGSTYYLEFDGTDDSMSVTTTLGTAWSMYCAGKHRTPVNNTGVYCCTYATSQVRTINSTIDSVWYFGNSVGSNEFFPSPVSSTVNRVVGAIRTDNTTAKYFADSTEKTFIPHATTGFGYYVGYNSTNAFAKLNYYGGIFSKNTAVGSTDHARAMSYLSGKMA